LAGVNRVFAGQAAWVASLAEYSNAEHNVGAAVVLITCALSLKDNGDTGGDISAFGVQERLDAMWTAIAE
jgi:hypothetical protein